jgi:iron complex transport system ATP-binding protein
MDGRVVTTPAFELEGVVAGYRGTPVLREVSLSWAAGERGALIGPNGAGKSTLLRVITGRLPASSGRVRLFGRPVGEIPAAERASLAAVVPQSFPAVLPFTIEELVLMGRTSSLSRWARPAAEERAAVEEALDQTDLQPIRRRRIGELSGGERQRAALAMALARKPRLLLLDEPTAHLDIHHGLEILERVERLNRQTGLTVLITNHDLGLAAEFSDRLILLQNGRVAADGPPTAVLREDLLRDVYQCDLRVRRDPPFGWTIRPARREASGDAGGV